MTEPMSHTSPPSSTPTSYSVEQVAPRVAREDLCRLWEDNLPLTTSAGSKFRWLYEDAPTPADTVFLLRAHSGRTGDVHVVGTNGAHVRRFQLAHGAGLEASHVGLCSDLAVESAHRTLQPAIKLVKAVTSFAGATYPMTYGFPNEKAKAVVVRAGFKVLGKMTRHVRVLRHASYASRVQERREIPKTLAWAVERGAETVAMRGVGALIDVATLARHPKEQLLARSRYELAWESSFDSRFDRLWHAAKLGYEIIGERTAKFLAWRYPHCEIATLVRRGAGPAKSRELDAYAIVHRDAANKAFLLDVFGFVDALDSLFELLLPALWWQGSPSVSVSFLGAPALAPILEARGFEARPAESRTIVVLPGKDATNQERERMCDPRRWHLFAIDEDA